MTRIFRVAVFLMLSLALVGGVALTGCSNGQAELKAPDITLASYAKGNSVDFNDATLNQIAEGGGEAGYKYGLAATLYPTYRYTTTARNTLAKALFGSPYKIGDATSETTFAQLTSGDALAVDGAIFATALTAQEQSAVTTAVAGFFDRVDTDMAAAKLPAETAAYGILKSGAGQAAADAWVADIVAGKNYADRFFVHLVKQFVVSMPVFFTDFYVALYGSVPATPTEDQIEAVAKLAGKTSFVSGTAGTMYPTQREEQSLAKYGKAYKDLNQLAGEPQLVDAEVYKNLPSAFGTGAAADAARAATRDGVAAGMKAVGYITADNYTAANEMEKAIVDQALFATALPGPSLERDYIDFAAVPGAVLGWGAEMAAAVPMQQNIAYLTLKSQVTTTAANNWVKDVEAGTHPRQAFYRWLSKETVSQSAAMGTLIQLGLAEFTLKITNPNKYQISVDSLNVVCQVASSALGAEELADAARQVIPEKIWVPADGESSIRVVAPVKTMDVITWAVLSGKATPDAQKLGADVWAQFQAGTAEWTVVVEAKVSNDTDTSTETYTLEL
jgi:hypothetical protein